jgi:hypothetical protein
VTHEILIRKRLQKLYNTWWLQLKRFWADILPMQWNNPNKFTQWDFPEYSPPHFSIFLIALYVKICHTLGGETTQHPIIILKILIPFLI